MSKFVSPPRELGRAESAVEGARRKLADFKDRARQRARLYRCRAAAEFSTWYYAFVSHAFDREMKAVAQGRALYFRQIASEGGNQALLRRNVHRLEKGLIMRPFRVPFAKDYILETSRAFAYLVRRRCAEDSEDLRWGADVLRTYFERAGAQRGVIDEAREIFENALASLELASDGSAHVPYPRGDAPLPVAYEPFAALCQRRRSVRWYEPGPVPRALVDQALEAALQSPSACNRQSFQFRFFDDPRLISAIANIPGGTKGYADSLPGLAVVIGKLGSYPEPRDRHVIYIDGALAAMSFMLALETLGLSSCAINWPDVASHERAIERLLHLAPDERVILLIGFGYADPTGLIPFSAKKPLSVMRRWNDEPPA